MVSWLWIAAGTAAAGPEDLHTGDLVFHRSRTQQSVLLAKVTGSPWTHVGVVFVRDDGPVVLEAGDPVRYVPFDDWAARALDGRIAVRRLRAAPDGLAPEVVAKLEAGAAARLGLRYDAAFDWSDRRMYCSELVYKLLTEATGAPVGELRRFGSFDLSDPVVRVAIAARWGEAPVDELVIAPSDLVDDARWASVCEGPIAECP